MGRELAKEFGFDAGDPDALDAFLESVAEDNVRAAYDGRDPDLVTRAGERLFRAAVGHESLATHVVGGVPYIEDAPSTDAVDPPPVVQVEGDLLCRVWLSDECGRERPEGSEVWWNDRRWYRLDRQRLERDGVRVRRGRLIAADGDEAVEADYAADVNGGAERRV